MLRNVLLLVILKGTFSASNLRVLMYVSIVLTNISYLQQNLPSNQQLYSCTFQQLPLTFRY